MTLTQEGGRNPELRLWPGVVAVSLQWAIRFGVPVVAPQATIFGVLGGLIGGLAVLVWWAFFSRAARIERWGAVVLMIVAVAAAKPLLHPSIATGMMGMMFVIHVVPGLSLALVGWAVATRRLPVGLRRATLVAAIVAACLLWALLRTDGVTGEGSSQLAWRWAPTPEQQLLARTATQPAAPPKAPAATQTPIERSAVPAGSEPAPAPEVPAVLPARPAAERIRGAWPGFRGPHRDGRVSGVRINIDWASSPPVEMWRRPIGPGWSSFAIGEGLAYTQEQRGDFEIVACYNAATGEPVWAHRNAARFWESNAGAGPRATPTLRNGRVYAFGATGILDALNAADGRLVWTPNHGPRYRRQGSGLGLLELAAGA